MAPQDADFIAPSFDRADTPLGERAMHGVMGPARTGKGLLSAVWAWPLHASGRMQVLHLGNLNFGEIVEISDLADQAPESLSNCLLVIDEIGQILRSQGGAFEHLVGSNMTQSGHQGLAILWTAIEDKRLPPTIFEMTQSVSWIRGFFHKRWTTHDRILRAMQRGKTLRDNRCAGWFPDSPHYAEHAGGETLLACPDTPEHVTVGYEMVSQAGSRYGQGKKRWWGWLHCAQRFYALNRTKEKIDARGRYLVTADSVREDAFDRALGDLADFLHVAHERGVHRIAAEPLARMAATEGIAMTVIQVQRGLRLLGVERARANGRTSPFYDLDRFVATPQQPTVVTSE